MAKRNHRKNSPFKEQQFSLKETEKNKRTIWNWLIAIWTPNMVKPQQLEILRPQDKISNSCGLT